MKKMLILLIFTMITEVAVATDAHVIYKDSLTTAEINTERVDSSFTRGLDLRAFKRIWLTIKIEGISRNNYDDIYVREDTAFANDSFFVFYQYSSDNENWYTHSFPTILDTLLKIKKGANDTIINIATTINRDSLPMGSFGRVLFIHRNDLTTETEIAGNSYTKKLTVWFNTIK